MTDQTKEELTATIQVLLIEIETDSKRAAQAVTAFSTLLEQIIDECGGGEDDDDSFEDDDSVNKTVVFGVELHGSLKFGAIRDARRALSLLKGERCDHDWRASDLICKKCHRGLTWTQGNMPAKFGPCNCKRGC